MILGNNGYIWITLCEPTYQNDDYKQVHDQLASESSGDQRKILARLRNCISALAQNEIMIFDTTIQYTYEASMKFEVSK